MVKKRRLPRVGTLVWVPEIYFDYGFDIVLYEDAERSYSKFYGVDVAPPMIFGRVLEFDKKHRIAHIIAEHEVPEEWEPEDEYL